MSVSTRTANFTPDSLAGWSPEHLDQLVARLAGVDQLTERAFLVLGEKVQSSYGRAREISEATRRSLHLLEEEDEASLLPRLQLLVERCSLWLDENQARSVDICGLLVTVVESLADLEQPLAGLRRVIKTVHSLRVTTRLEAAKSAGAGGHVLASSLKELGVLVEQKVGEVSTLTESLVDLSRAALSAETQISEGALRQARNEVVEARRGLTWFSGSRVQTAEWNSRLKSRSEAIAGSFGELVAALQFQDITRQRLEHVQGVLGDLGQRLNELASQGGSCRDPEVTGLLGSICHLQYEQLDLSVGEFVAATESLKANLQGMADNVTALAEDTRGFSRSTSDGGGQFFTGVTGMLESISARLETTCSTHDQARSVLVETCQEIAAVAPLVDDIEYISEEMQLLAINAAISAAHARQRGAGLEVIAENIHLLSEEATREAESLARSCQRIRTQADQLASLGQGSHTEGRSIEALLRESRELMEGLSGNSDSLDEVARRIDRDAGQLATQVADVVRAVDIHDRFQDHIAPVLTQLRELGTWADDSLVGGSLSLEDLLRQLEQRYTMSSERDIHRRFVVRHRPHTATQPADQADEPAGQEHDLGDNIVLF